MLKNVTLLPAQLDGKTTWRLLGPDGMLLESFGVFADSLIRKHPLNTRRSYCRHLAEFFDYLFEASMALQADDPQIKLTRLVLQKIIEGFDEYLVLGGSSGSRVALLVHATKPSPMHAPATSALMHAPLRKFLKLSEQLRKEMAEMAREGLAAPLDVDQAPLLHGMGARETVSGHQRNAMSATSMISGVISGGPRLLRRAILPTVSPQVPYEESRAFPFDSVADFIDELPTHRDKALYAILAASGARMSEGVQLLFDDVDVNNGTIALRSPRLRANHPSYLALRPDQREKLAWKGRTTEKTLLIEPFASMFFANLELYLRHEYIPHGLHRFIFQYSTKKLSGTPYFLSAASSRLQIFRGAVTSAGIDADFSGPHSLRHAYGTYLLNYFPRLNGDYGLPVSLVQQLLGHKDVNSTLKYAQHDEDLMKLELQHANAMVFRGAESKSIVQLKLEALNAQVRKLQAELNVLQLPQRNQ
jgi:integrase